VAWIDMQRRFFSLDEIRDAMVIDSEGFIYGYVKDLQVLEEDVGLAVYISSRVNEPVVDVEKLQSILSSRASLRGDEPLELLVSLARRDGLDIPYKVAEKEVKWLKGFVPVSEIQLIDIKRTSVDNIDSLIKVILLKTPREAIFRGLPARGPKPVYRVDQVLNKIIVSMSRGVLGIAKEVVIGAGEIGFRVYRVRSLKKVVNWIAFTAQVKRLGFKEAYERLVEFRDPYRFSKLDVSIAKDVEEVLKDLKEKDKVVVLLQEFVEVEPGAIEFEDIPSSDVVKVGDVVISK
jgi:sporulation protein YlmC with PRC-barrel domain